MRLCSPNFAFAIATVGNRSQPFATVCVSAVRLSTMASASGVVPKSSRHRVKLTRCRRSYIGICRGAVCVSDLGTAVILALAEELSV